jgi:signal transduction histidine kinase
MLSALRRWAAANPRAWLILIFVVAVLLPSIALSALSFDAVPKQAEAWKMERYKRAERVLFYVEEDLGRAVRARALEAAKRVGLERLLDGRREDIEAALAEAGFEPGMFQSLRLEGYSKVGGADAGTTPDPASSLKEALDVDVPQATDAGEESLPVLGADSRSSGVLRFRFSCSYVHGTLIREYFQKDFANPDLVVRMTESDGRVIHETATSPAERDFEVKRTMTSPSFRGMNLFLRYKEGSIRGDARKMALVRIALIGFIDLMLGAGLYLVFSNVRRELLLSRLKSDFVANVSHELKTPLALIRLFSETLELGRAPSEDKRSQYYRVIHKESIRLTQLINNILDFSRIEAGRREYNFGRKDVTRVLDEVLEAYRYQIEQQGFQLEVRLAEGLPEVELDPEALGQALINLLNNAIKYSRDDKRITVDVRTEGGRLLLSVSDRGIGIAKSEQKKIFEKFYRAEDSLVHETKGSGLGLSLVRHIALAHGGTVEVESTPGRGSTFTIALPIPGRATTRTAEAAPLEGSA